MAQDDRTLRLGQLALDRGLISAEQLYQALEEQTRAAAAGAPARSLPQILVEKGYLKQDQVALLSDLPRAFGKYELLRELGRGGMGIVYEAKDNELGRRVALKMLLTSPNADAVESQPEEDRFLREAKLTAKLSRHANIVSVYEAGIIEGRRYLAMELIEGRSFGAWRKAASPAVREQVAVLRDVALAVHHAHQQGVVHRDLKPDNVLLDAQLRPHVTDFGLAKSVGQDVSLSLTATGMVIGTPSYMSPEQALGLKSADHRSDLYAMGVVLYEILTGQAPFAGETAIEILLKASKNPVTPPSSVLKTVDRTLEKICLKCLAKKPKDRYDTAEALAADLTKWLNGEPVQVKVVRENEPRPWIMAAAVGALVLIGALAWSIERLRQERDQAREAAGAAAPKPVDDRFGRGLVAHWKLDEGAGTTISDASGLRRTGRLVDGARWVGGRLHFDGVNGHVELENTADLDVLRNGSSTISLWFRPDDLPSGKDDDNRSGYRLIASGWGGLTLLPEGDVMAQYRPPGQAQVAVSGGEGPRTSGTWQHVAAVVGGAESTLILYVDGRARKRKTFSAGPSSGSSVGPWRIGILHPGAGTWRWAAKGAIDSIRVYDRALSAEEVEALVASEAPAHGR